MTYEEPKCPECGEPAGSVSCRDSRFLHGGGYLPRLRITPAQAERLRGVQERSRVYDLTGSPPLTDDEAERAVGDLLPVSQGFLDKIRRYFRK